MPTLADIEDLNGALEAPFAAGVNAALGFMPYLLANDLQRRTPRVEITVSIQNALPNARRAFPAEGITRDVRWNFNVKLLAVTRPADALTIQDGENEDQFRARQNANFQLHEQMVAALRAYASSAAQNSWADQDNFPLHFIAERLREVNAAKRIKNEEGNHQTALTYSGILAVRESAWRGLESATAPATPQPVITEIDDSNGNPLVDSNGNELIGVR